MPGPMEEGSISPAVPTSNQRDTTPNGMLATMWRWRLLVRGPHTFTKLRVHACPMLLVIRSSTLLLPRHFAFDKVYTFLPLLRTLQWMERNVTFLQAHARVAIWKKHLRVRHESDSQRIHTTFKISILATIEAEIVLATLCIVEIYFHRPLGEDLNGT